MNVPLLPNGERCPTPEELRAMRREEADRAYGLMMRVAAAERWTPDQKALLNYFLNSCIGEDRWLPAARYGLD